MTFIIHFVKYESDEKTEIREHFLGFIPINDTNGGSLTSVLLIQFEDHKIFKMSEVRV